MTAADITTVSYVQRRDGGRVPFADLSAPDKERAASRLKVRYLAELLAGKAEIRVKENNE